MAELLDTNAKIEIIAEGHEWTEVLVWLEEEQKLLYSDIPMNRIYEWTAEKGKQVYLKRAGFSGEKARGGELGSNGLLLDDQGRLVLCQHGNSRIARMEAKLSASA